MAIRDIYSYYMNDVIVAAGASKADTLADTRDPFPVGRLFVVGFLLLIIRYPFTTAS